MQNITIPTLDLIIIVVFLVGITLMTQYYDAGVQISQRLKAKIKAPIIWGGIHPTVRPEESLNHADIVCIGEGEMALLELIQKMEHLLLTK